MTRNVPQGVIDCADTVTDMTKVKHVYDAGIVTRVDIEF